MWLQALYSRYAGLGPSIVMTVTPLSMAPSLPNHDRYWLLQNLKAKATITTEATRPLDIKPRPISK